MLRTVFLTVVAAALAFALDMALASLALRLTRVPAGFPPFTTLPILSGAIGGAVGASLVYSLLRATSRQPERAFFFVTLVVFVLSMGLPLRLSFTRSARFAGVTPSAQAVLILMHAVVATVTFVTLTSANPPTAVHP